MEIGSIIASLAAGGVGILGYILREKNAKIMELEEKQGKHEIRIAVMEEANRGRDDRLERVELKLDRILEKLGA